MPLNTHLAVRPVDTVTFSLTSLHPRRQDGSPHQKQRKGKDVEAGLLNPAIPSMSRLSPDAASDRSFPGKC